MRRLRLLSTLGLVAAFLGGCQQPTPPVRPLAPGIVPEAVLAKAALQSYWRYKVALNPGERIARIWRLEENLYALTTGNRLIALDAARGMYKWSQQVAEPQQTVFAPCHADGVLIPEPVTVPSDKPRYKSVNVVIINSLTYAVMMERDTGERVRKLDFRFADVANSPGCSDGNCFYVGTVKGWYHAVRLTDGLTQWTMATRDLITARPVVFSRRLYVASNDGRFAAVNPDPSRDRDAGTDRRLWAQATDGPLTADFFADARGCFVPSQDFRLYAYNSVTGEDLWTFRTQGPLLAGVQVGKQTVFQYSDRDRFYAVDLATGRARWDLPEGRLVLAVIGPAAYVLTADRRLLVVDEVLGTVEKSLPMTGLTLFAGNAAKPVIYAANNDGAFVCIRALGSGQLTEEMLQEAPRPTLRIPTSLPTSVPTSAPSEAPAAP